MSPDVLIIDDRTNGGLTSNLGTSWRLVTDTVMGGVSQGRLRAEVVQGRPCLRMTGEVCLENNGGFIQASLELGTDAVLDISAFSGFELDIYGNGESYNLHLRTADTRIVWQSYRASFHAMPGWQTVRLPFSVFQAHRLNKPLDLRVARKTGLVAIGRAFQADLCIGRVVLFK